MYTSDKVFQQFEEDLESLEFYSQFVNYKKFGLSDKEIQTKINKMKYNSENNLEKIYKKKFLIESGVIDGDISE